MHHFKTFILFKDVCVYEITFFKIQNIWDSNVLYFKIFWVQIIQIWNIYQAGLTHISLTKTNLYFQMFCNVVKVSGNKTTIKKNSWRNARCVLNPDQLSLNEKPWLYYFLHLIINVTHVFQLKRQFKNL